MSMHQIQRPVASLPQIQEKYMLSRDILHLEPKTLTNKAKPNRRRTRVNVPLMINSDSADSLGKVFPDKKTRNFQQEKHTLKMTQEETHVIDDSDYGCQ